MHSADNHDILILRAVILKLSRKDQLGDEGMIRQIIYITDSTDKLFLSRKACMDLGIISTHFLLWVWYLLSQITLCPSMLIMPKLSEI